MRFSAELSLGKIIFFLFTCFFSLEVAAQDSVFADSSRYYIRSVSFSGNKTTKQFILERELTFHPGDTLSGPALSARIVHSRENLLNTSLFNFVTISPSCEKDSSVNGVIPVSVNVTVHERWYTWPVPIFEVSEQNFNTWWRHGRNLDRASYGFFLWRYNFRGRKESIALICRFGYSVQYGAQYSIPYLNRKKTFGVTLTGTYTRTHEIAVSTQNNELVYFKDRAKYIRGEALGSMMFSWRPGIYIAHTLDVRYSSLWVDDTVAKVSSGYFVQGRTRMDYFSLSYRFVYDHRDIKAYALHGQYAELELTKHGLGLLRNEDLNVFYVVAGVRQYAEILPRIFLGFMIRGRFLVGPDPPYYHQRALGFATYVRGYEYYVIDGQDFLLTKLNLKYQIVKPHVFHIPYLPVEKFNVFHIAVYGGIFADAGRVNDRTSLPADDNYLGNQTLFGYGAGIDFVTYYDIALRVEYAFNRMGENGLFLHLGAPF
ncbi:MAG TPA: POTRA domain-containing protein [Bacteroidia bacterium]|nr:POTRA domain-containing protein [Bacteroidia bacterium]